ncbi:DUF2235 domain-containing protein [Geodermatophilus sp. URMC 64]
MARRLSVCCDGTWQDVAQDSNVARLHRAIVPDPGDPDPLYVKGVGVSPDLLERLRGGLTGAGLDEAITGGYRWLVEHFRAGDRIAVFGFSRGAYTARSLAGMIGRVGLVDGSGLTAEQVDDAVDRAYAHYRALKTGPDDPDWDAGLRFAYRAGDPGIPVDLVGVWDTVGALGIPAYVGIPDIGGSRERYQFLDVVLDPHIAHGRHAVSLDEMRGPFRPTLWRDIPPDQDVRQVWFPGDHSDVGGGHADTGLSDGALDWMMREATAAIGLTFDRSRIAGFRPDAGGALHGEWHGAAGAVLEVTMQPRPRAVPRIDAGRPDPDVDGSAYERQRATGYRRTRTLSAAGDTATVTVPADRSWTATGLYLEPGSYRFAADGRWSSAGDACGPAGETGGRHRFGSVASGLIGAAQGLLRGLLHNPEAGLVGARREPAHPWLSLVALVGNEQTDATGAVTHPDEKAFVGEGTTEETRRSGYLHGYPNDAFGFYGNNDGAVELTVTRA